MFKLNTWLRSLLVLAVERFNGVHVEGVVHVGVPFEGGLLEQFAAVADLIHEFLILHVTVRESWQLAALPRVVADVDAVVERPEEEETVHDHAELVDVPELNRVHGLHHFD